MEDAGFSVGNLKLTGNFNDLNVENDKHVTIENSIFHFVNVSSQVLTGEQTFTIVEKNFLTSKQYKKYSSASKMECFHTGKSAACCLKDGVPAEARVYHVTI